MERETVDYNQLIFCNYVWEHLANKPDNVVREFVNIMVEANKHYIESGGTYPTIEYIMGMAIDRTASSDRAQSDCTASSDRAQSDCTIPSDRAQSDCTANIKYDCPFNNPDCQRYGHEGQGCQCECHGSMSDTSDSSDTNETIEQKRERVRNSWINKFK